MLAAKRRGESFDDAWDRIVRPDRPLVTRHRDPAELPDDCVIWQRDTFDRQVSRTAILETRDGWQAAWENREISTPALLALRMIASTSFDEQGTSAGPPARPPSRPPEFVHTRATIIGAIRAWNERHGHPPTGNVWNTASSRRPSTAKVVAIFGSFPEAVRAAGLEPRVRVGQVPDQQVAA